MNRPEPVFWHQGMFLQPQHFQADALHAQARLGDLIDAIAPDLWGLAELEIAQAALANHSFQVRRARLRFARGEVLHYPGNAVIAPRSFDPAWFDTGAKVDVYLGLRAMTEGTPNVSLCDGAEPAAQAATRLATQLRPPERADLYSDGPAAQVRTLQHVLRVSFEPELEHLHGYELLAIARLVHDGEGVRLDESFIPPCYALGACEPLSQMLADMRDEIGARLRQLEELKSEPGSQPGERTGARRDDLQLMLALRALAGASCWLTQACDKRHERPALVHARLRELVAELSCFSTRCDALGATPASPEGLAPFDPLHLRECFSQLRLLLRLLLQDISVGPAYVLPLVPCDGALCAKVPEAAFGRRNEFFLMLSAATAPARWAPQVEFQARLAAPSTMASLVTHSLPGMALHALSAVPPGLPARPRSAYWRVGHSGSLWDAAQREGALQLHWPAAPAELQASLVVVERAR
ncbi:MAG: type VI secretion system baseplate subunit TssK [Betaproteobacteria bacterium]|nr:type VI secretion system baseplate subunit TssK [Betaproteobacteria bacterium]MBU6512762.1 type VI secretion system baseplate subunit TssK [Betaproteobacteria bacterium]MDE1955105.1 type VI secretion system baseplate subunit TssK [Betaproteobacteria bacterium]MDE2152925.1 type VI secretion system baseplate subunit TssK [Betaproteobacteria bacterium]